MIAAGLISLFFNVLTAGYGYVDQFVTPLSADTQNKRMYMEAVQRGEIRYPPQNVGNDSGLSDQATVVLTMSVLMCLSVASVAAVWAGYGGR